MDLAFRFTPEQETHLSDNPPAPTPAPGPAARPVADQLAEAQSALRARDVELAVYKTAGTAGVDAAALLDSRSFMAKVDGLDHTAETYSTDMAALITEAAADSRFAAQAAPAAPARSGPDVHGTPEPAKHPDQMSVDELREARAKRRTL
jgi:hypothetical protein